MIGASPDGSANGMRLVAIKVDHQISMEGHQKLECELTVRDGAVLWDLNGTSRPDWKVSEKSNPTPQSSGTQPEKK